MLLILIWPDSALSRRVAEAESILTEPVVWAWSVPRKSDTRKRAAVSGEGTRKALWRRPFGGEALLDFEQGLQLDREQGLDHRLAPGPELFQIPYHLGAAALVSVHKGFHFSCSRKRRQGSLAVCYLIRSPCT